jgi:hypothetical protein
MRLTVDGLIEFGVVCSGELAGEIIPLTFNCRFRVWMCAGGLTGLSIDGDLVFLDFLLFSVLGGVVSGLFFSEFARDWMTDGDSFGGEATYFGDPPGLWPFGDFLPIVISFRAIGQRINLEKGWSEDNGLSKYREDTA